MASKVVVLKIDDWEGVYIDGVLYDQHHEIERERPLQKAGYDYKETWVEGYYRWMTENPPDDFDEGYPFPEKLETWEKWCKECDDSNT